jgi:predicted aconitase
MTLILDERDREMLAGESGPAVQLAMRILTRMGALVEAESMLDISRAHIDSAIYLGQAGLEFAERLANLGARVVIPTTLNVSGVDEHGWKDWSVPAEWAENAGRQMAAYVRMGCLPTWTCAPYQTEHAPRFGEQIAWGESNAIVFANSVLGARTERYPDLLDICAAITGRVPAHGLHLARHRAGDVLFRIPDLPARLAREDGLYPVLGYLIGKWAGDRVPVIDAPGLAPTEDQLKAFGAAAASSGNVGLFHWIGVTPEAPTVSAAFHGRPLPEATIVTLADVRHARAELTTGPGEALDLVVLGSPHFSLQEFRALSPLLEGKRRHRDVGFLVTTSRAVAHLARQAGLLDSLEAFGGRLTVDTCILASPMLPAEVHRLMTNSGKYAYYAPGMLKAQVTYGTLSDCVSSAAAGRVVVDEGLWND